MRPFVLILATLALSGCATVFRAGAPPRPVTAPDITQAKAALDTALAARDAAALAALFDDEGLLVTSAGDTLRGGRAAAAHLLRPTATPPFVRIDFFPELRLAQCHGGGFERGRLRLLLQALPAGEEHPVGRYRVHWRALPGGGARIAALSFLEADSNLDLSPEACTFPERDRFRTSRVSVAVYPGFISARGAAVGGSAADALRAQGWQDDIAVCVQHCDMVPGPRTTGHDARPPLSLAAVTLRPRGPLTVTLSAGPGLAGETTGFEGTERSTVVLRHEGLVAGVTAGVTWGFVEAGIGPAVQRIDWHLGERVFPQWDPTVAERTQWQVGALGRLRLSFPVTERLALDAMGEARLFPAGTTPAVGQVTAARVRTHGAAIALGFRYFR